MGNKPSVYVTGMNHADELGHPPLRRDAAQFCRIKHKNIPDAIYSGYRHTIYANTNKNYYRFAGEGTFGTESAMCEFLSNNKIKRIRTNVCNKTSFWITYDNKVYCHRLNVYDQNPVLMSNETNMNVIDIQMSNNMKTALCKHTTDTDAYKMIGEWSNISECVLPNDIIQLIATYYFCSTVYSIQNESNKWVKMQIFENTLITKIKTGLNHCLFLDSNCMIWSMGDNSKGQCGVNDDDEADAITQPMQIMYFAKNNILIKDICCGSNHTLAIDKAKRIYGWGANSCGECGDGTRNNITIPKCIDALKDFGIEAIECGYQHSYCKTLDQKHYFWGVNKHNECILTRDEKECLLLPYCVNHIIAMHTKGTIKAVSLGFCNTKLIIQ